MPEFEYQATDPEGRPVADVIEADSRMMATVKLRQHASLPAASGLGPAPL